MTPNPLISVVIPAYNISRYIAEALESVLRQTYTRYEIVVVNDGSLDTPSLTQALEPYRNQITCITQPNRGPGAARNAGIQVARGEYVALLDGDDMWHPDFLAYMLGTIQRQQAQFVYCDTRMFGDTGRAGRTYMEFAPSEGPCTFEAIVRGTVNVCTSTVLMLRSAVVEAGLFNERVRFSEDFDLWTRMALNGVRFGYDGAVLGRRRLHAQCISANPVNMLRGTRDTYLSLLSNPNLPADMRPVIRECLTVVNGQIAVGEAREFMRAGDSVTALHALSGAGHARTWKVQLAIAVLRTAPAVVPVLTRAWDAVLELKQHVRTLRPA